MTSIDPSYCGQRAIASEGRCAPTLSAVMRNSGEPWRSCYTAASGSERDDERSLVLLTVRLLQVVILVGLATLSHAQPISPVDAPEKIRAPAAEKVILVARASGSQIYVCQQASVARRSGPSGRQRHCSVIRAGQSSGATTLAPRGSTRMAAKSRAKWWRKSILPTRPPFRGC